MLAWKWEDYKEDLEGSIKPINKHTPCCVEVSKEQRKKQVIGKQFVSKLEECCTCFSWEIKSVWAKESFSFIFYFFEEGSNVEFVESEHVWTVYDGSWHSRACRVTCTFLLIWHNEAPQSSKLNQWFFHLGVSRKFLYSSVLQHYFFDALIILFVCSTRTRYWQKHFDRECQQKKLHFLTLQPNADHGTAKMAISRFRVENTMLGRNEN